MKKQFNINDMLTTLGSTFYPTHHVMVMVKSKSDIDIIEPMLQNFKSYATLTPQEIIEEIGKTIKENNDLLPSVGTEGMSAIKFINQAKKGQHAILIEVNNDNEKEKLVEVLDNIESYYAEYYRALVIEDFYKP